MTTIYHWLVVEGLWRDCLSFAIGGLLLYLVGKFKVLRALSIHERRQQHIEELLDTTKPGGLTAVVESNERITEAYKHAQQAPAKPPPHGKR
jgi:hypothetical protein